MLLLAGLVLAQEVYFPTIELERKDKTVVAQQTSEKGTFVAEYGDIEVGQVRKVDEKRLELSSGKVYQPSPDSRYERGGKPAKLSDFKPGEWVELAFNDEKADADNPPLIMRLKLRKNDIEDKKKKEYNFVIISDIKPARVKVQFGKDATAFGPLALVDKGIEETVYLSDGSANIVKDKPDDPDEASRLELSTKATPEAIEVLQGKSRVFGTDMRYDNETGEAKIAGPIRLERSSDKPLKGSSKDMVYNVDDEVLRLFGDIKLEQDGRTTTAQSAVVREKDRVAYLYGSAQVPVKSTNKDGFVEGTKVLYNLDKGDVTVLEGVKGEFKDD